MSVPTAVGLSLAVNWGWRVCDLRAPVTMLTCFILIPSNAFSDRLFESINKPFFNAILIIIWPSCLGLFSRKHVHAVLRSKQHVFEIHNVKIILSKNEIGSICGQGELSTLQSNGNLLSWLACLELHRLICGLRAVPRRFVINKRKNYTF